MSRLVDAFANAFGTKTAIVIALVWSLLPVVWVSGQTLVLYVSAGVVQLVALPLLAYQARQGSKQREQIAATLAEHHHLLGRIHQHITGEQK